jgi:hypothetical protein
MAGKKKQNSQGGTGWGGNRPGSGRKPAYMLTENQLKAMHRKARKWAKETGYDIDQFLLAVIGGDKETLGVDNVPLRDRIACAKLFKEFTMTKVSETNVNVSDMTYGPRIGLPPVRRDPALEIVKSEKTK